MLDLLLIAGISSTNLCPDKNFSRRSFSISSLYYSLKDKIDVKIYIPEIYNNYDNLPEAKYYGVSIFIDEKFAAKNLIETIRNKYPKSIIFCGGPYPALDSSFVLNFVDFIVYGDGVKPVRDIIINKEDYHNHLNVFTKTHKGVRSLPDLTQPYSYWVDDPEAFVDYSIYEKESVASSGHNYYPLMIGEGCFFNCNFCSSKMIYGQKTIYRNLEWIEKDVIKILSNSTVTNIFLTVPIANESTEKNYHHLEEIFKILIKHGFDKNKMRLTMFVKTSLVSDTFLNLLKKYSSSLNYHLFAGIENFNDSALKTMNRSETKQSIFEMFYKIKQCHDGIVEISGNILFGFMGDNDEILLENIESIREVHSLFKNTDVAIKICPAELQNYPGSNFYANAECYPEIFDINSTDQDCITNDQYGINKNWSKLTRERIKAFNEHIYINKG